MYIISQIIETIALIVTLGSYHLKKKDKIFKGMCVANILEMLHYLLLGAWSGFATKVVALIRNIFIIEKEHNRKLRKPIFLYIFIGIYLVISVLTFKNVFSLLPISAAIIYMIFVWNGDELQVKKISFLCYFLWLAYNICILSVMGIISNIVALISTYIAYDNMKKYLRKKENNKDSNNKEKDSIKNRK